MNKNQLIRLHADLVKIKLQMERSEDGLFREFQNYYDLGISPLHIHKSKGEHEQAIFLLLEQLLTVVSNNANEASYFNHASYFKNNCTCHANCILKKDCPNRKNCIRLNSSSFKNNDRSCFNA